MILIPKPSLVVVGNELLFRGYYFVGIQFTMSSARFATYLSYMGNQLGFRIKMRRTHAN
jgi:hypothetical protein